MNILVAFISSSIPLGVPLLYGSTGEILTEKSGHLNLGIPGIMYVGAISGVIGAFLYESAVSVLNPALAILIPLLCSIAGSVLMGLIYSFMTVTLRANQNVTGLALTTFGVGLMKVIFSKLDAHFNTAPSDYTGTTGKVIHLISKKYMEPDLSVEMICDQLGKSRSYLSRMFKENTGMNLLEPGETPHENAQFLLFLAAIIKAVWGYPDLGSIKKLQVNMANIRKKLGIKPGDNRYILNELGVGYRMREENE